MTGPFVDGWFIPLKTGNPGITTVTLSTNLVSTPALRFGHITDKDFNVHVNWFIKNVSNVFMYFIGF